VAIFVSAFSDPTCHQGSINSLGTLEGADAPRGATSRGLRLTMEWIVPVIVETRNVHQDILADRQSIAQAQAASQTLREQLIALAHSAEMGIHQLQQELHLASAIKSMLEESNPSLRLHWPEFCQEDLLMARPAQEGASTHTDHASVARAGPDGAAATGLFYACTQGVIDDPAAPLATATSSAWPSAGAPPAEALQALSTPCWTGAAAKTGLGTTRHDTARPSAVTEVQRTPLTATEAPLILSQGSASMASPGLTTQGVIAAVPVELAAATHHLPPKAALKMARCVPASPAAEKVPTVDSCPTVAAAVEYGRAVQLPALFATALDAHAQPRLHAAWLAERARSRAHEQQRPGATREASADVRALAPAPAAVGETGPATRAPVPAAAAPAPAPVGAGQPPRGEGLRQMG